MERSLLLIIVLFIFPDNLFAQLGFGIGSLQGLKGVNVYISVNSEDPDRSEIYQNNALSNIENKMRSAGITVLSYEELHKLETREQLLYPTLDINVMERESGDSRSGLHAYYVTVSIVQHANLLRNRNLITNSYGWKTWLRNGLGIVSEKRVESSIRETINKFLDEFTKDYYVANPGD